MLTRLKVTGFKNLVDVDIRFGPFTCVAGSNGVGKSNLFDAIAFLSALAGSTFVDAARSIRGGKTLDVASLFHRVGAHHDEIMTLMAEMIIPRSGAGDFGQEVRSATTFLRYSLELALRGPEESLTLGPIELRKESLTHINISDAPKNLLFRHSAGWRLSALTGRRGVPFISTVESSEDPAIRNVSIQLHQDQGGRGGGRPTPFPAALLVKTVLSSVNAVENQTAVLVRQEMRSWRQLQLEPTALREPDAYNSTSRLGSDGSHLAATLHRLVHNGANRSELSDLSTVSTRVANRLADLLDDVREVGVEDDPKRELYTLFAAGKDGTRHSARALSDGTLRFLALSIIELDPNAQGVLCLEEPENGIHPARIPAMLQLLQDIAFDADEPIGTDNPLRQVIINTHSPAVVSEVDDGSLVFAKLGQEIKDGKRFSSVRFLGLVNTWRTTKGDEPAEKVPRGDLMVYLQGPHRLYGLDEKEEHLASENGQPIPPRSTTDIRVIDRPDLQPWLSFGDDPR